MDRHLTESKKKYVTDFKYISQNIKLQCSVGDGTYKQNGHTLLPYNAFILYTVKKTSKSSSINTISKVPSKKMCG